MTKEDIIRMAEEAYKTCDHIPNLKIPKEFIERFAILIASAERDRLTDFAIQAAEKSIDVAIALEREACAELCEMLDVENAKGKSWDEGTIDCANAIRARGQA